MDLQLKAKTYLVTGASSGLGRATADALMAEGANVVAVARRGDRLETWRREAGEQLAVYEGDLTERETAPQACRAALETFGGLDGGFVSVGGPPPGTVLDAGDDTWMKAFDLVVLSALRVARQVVAQAATPPVLGFVLSSSARQVLPGMAMSNALRPGLAMLVKQLGDEIGPKGGRTFGLMPGNIDTERLASLHEGTGDAEGARARAEAAIPLGRIGEPAEFARVAAFLMSPAASYVSGCVIPVDGGLLRMP